MNNNHSDIEENKDNLPIEDKEVSKEAPLSQTNQTESENAEKTDNVGKGSSEDKISKGEPNASDVKDNKADDVEKKDQETSDEDSEKPKPLTTQQMMNRFIPFKDMPVGTIFELSGLKMRKMEYARRPDEEGYFNAIQLGIENGYMWVKEDNSFKVVPAHSRRKSSRSRRKKYGRGRNRNRSNSNQRNNNRNQSNSRSSSKKNQRNENQNQK